MILRPPDRANNRTLSVVIQIRLVVVPGNLKKKRSGALKVACHLLPAQHPHHIHEGDNKMFKKVM